MSFDKITVTGEELDEVIDAASDPTETIREINRMVYPSDIRWSKVSGLEESIKCGRDVWHSVYTKLRYKFTKKRNKTDLRSNPIRAASLWTNASGWQIDGSLGQWEVKPGKLAYKDD